MQTGERQHRAIERRETHNFERDMAGLVPGGEKDKAASR
jgi:hypothetical protein